MDGGLLNWRFQQGLYRAYYDAYIKQRLMYETGLMADAKAVLDIKGGEEITEAKVKQVRDILSKATTEPVATELRARVFELGEALYQSIRMQLSVKKYQAIRTNRGANLDEIDKPLAGLRDVNSFIRKMEQRKVLESGQGLVGQYYNSAGFADLEDGMIDLLLNVNHDWGKDRGRDWSGKWVGFIEAPVTGEITFIAEARDSIRLTIGGTVVIDGLAKAGPRTGKIRMVKGTRMPINLDFSSGSGKALLRLSWQWANHGYQLVPGSALSHSSKQVPADAELFDYDNR